MIDSTGVGWHSLSSVKFLDNARLDCEDEEGPLAGQAGKQRSLICAPRVVNEGHVFYDDGYDKAMRID